MAKRYDYVVLDIDGTLYSHNKYFVACKIAGKRLYKYATSLGVSRDFLRRFDKYLRRGKVTYPSSEICKRYGFRRMPFMDHVYDLDPSKFGIEGSPLLLKEINSIRKITKIAFFTNSPGIWSMRVLSILGIAKAAPKGRIITLERMDKGKFFKPSEKAFRKMLGILRTTPDKVVFLDDDLKNVKAARKLGIRSIHICNDGRCHLPGHSRSRTVHEELHALAINMS